jgi:hypothetical protein
MNALLEHVPINERTAVLDHCLPHAVSTWTLPGGISASDDDDQERLLRFLNQKPQIERAMLAQIEARTRCLNRLADAAQRGAGNVMSTLPAPAQISVAAGASWPPRPAPNDTMRLGAALNACRARHAEALDTQTDRSADDKHSLLDRFIE